MLEEIGVIGSKHWSDATRYDLNLEPHLDVRCAKCGAVSEIPGIELEELEESIRHNTPYEVTRTTIVVEGLCPSCKLIPGARESTHPAALHATPILPARQVRGASPVHHDALYQKRVKVYSKPHAIPGGTGCAANSPERAEVSEEPRDQVDELARGIEAAGALIESLEEEVANLRRDLEQASVALKAAQEEVSARGRALEGRSAPAPRLSGRSGTSAPSSPSSVPGTQTISSGSETST